MTKPYTVTHARCGQPHRPGTPCTTNRTASRDAGGSRQEGRMMTTEPTTLTTTLDMIAKALQDVDNLVEIAIDQATTDSKHGTD
jgi:hypothetical protein